MSIKTGDATNGRRLIAGAGTPESSVVADVGTFYIDNATGTIYTKTTGAGNTGWSAVGGGGGGMSAPVDITAQCSIYNAITDVLSVFLQTSGKRVFIDVWAVWNNASGPVAITIPNALASIANSNQWVAPSKVQDLGVESSLPGLAQVNNGNPYIEMRKGWKDQDNYTTGAGGQSYSIFCINYPIV